MTVASSINRVTYSGNGATTAFSFPYLFFADGDLLVISVDAAGVETTKALTTDYTVSGAGDDAGGTVTMLTAPAASTQLVIYRQVDYVQELDLVENDRLPAESLEKALDLMVMMGQQLNEQLDRTLRFPIGDSVSLSAELPPAVDRASKALIFDANGTVDVSTDDYEDQLANVTAQAVAAAASASAASTSASNAATSASNANTSASNAATSASNANTSASNAATSESNANASAVAAAASANDAQVAKIEWRGAWDANTTYTLNDAVSYGGSSWVSTQSGANQTPADTVYWDPLALKATSSQQITSQTWLTPRPPGPIWALARLQPKTRVLALMMSCS
jgi:hypothetical protein